MVLELKEQQGILFQPLTQDGGSRGICSVHVCLSKRGFFHQQKKEEITVTLHDPNLNSMYSVSQNFSRMFKAIFIVCEAEFKGRLATT